MADFLNAVRRECEGLTVAPGAAPGCTECLECGDPDEPGDDWYDLANEPHFSRTSCDSCGSRLGGDRYPAHGVPSATADAPVVHMDVCVDCLMFHANGDEPEDWRMV